MRIPERGLRTPRSQQGAPKVPGLETDLCLPDSAQPARSWPGQGTEEPPAGSFRRVPQGGSDGPLPEETLLPEPWPWRSLITGGPRHGQAAPQDDPEKPSEGQGPEAAWLPTTVIFRGGHPEVGHTRPCSPICVPSMSELGLVGGHAVLPASPETPPSPWRWRRGESGAPLPATRSTAAFRVSPNPATPPLRGGP